MRACLHCGEPLTGRRRKYCSDRCQGNAGNHRYRAAHPDLDRERSRARRAANPAYYKAAHKEWRDRNREHLRAYYRRKAVNTPNIHVLYQHGVSPSELEALYEEQGGRCAICDKPGAMRGRGCLVIDHDHVTGERRGLICHDCNKAIPVMERVGPTWALRALAYLGDPPLPRMRKRRKTS